jgi:hypothetical protein
MTHAHGLAATHFTGSSATIRVERFTLTLVTGPAA